MGKTDKKKKPVKKVHAKGLDEAFAIGDNENGDNKELPIVDSCVDGIVEGAIIEPVEDGETESEKDLSDSDFIRAELRTNIQTAKTALARALEIQEEEEKARNTEVVSDLIDTINSCLSQLINLNKIEADINIKRGKMEDDGNKSPATTTNNILVTGNTSEILKQLTDGMKK